MQQALATARLIKLLSIGVRMVSPLWWWNRRACLDAGGYAMTCDAVLLPERRFRLFR
jgi:hypothetical protein